MIDIQKAIKKVIERFIVNKVPITSDLSIGVTSIPVQSSRRYQCDDEVAIYSQLELDSTGEGEWHIVVDIPDNNHIIIDNPLVGSYSQSDSYVEKMVGGTFLQGVYLGDPDVIPRYPAITIDAKSTSHSWLTLESTTAEYNIDISVYVEAADYERSYEIMHSYAKAVQNGLFRSFYPLVEPFDSTTLAEDANTGDTIIKLTDEDMLVCGNGTWIWLESWDFLRFNGVRQYLGNGVYELIRAIDIPFSAGDLVIRPQRHIYNSLPAQVQFGIVNKNTMLRAASINYVCSEEVRRYTNYIDSLIL